MVGKAIGGEASLPEDVRAQLQRGVQKSPCAEGMSAVTVCLEARHIEWLEQRTRVDKAERLGAPDWNLSKTIERIIRQAYAQDPGRVTGPTGPRADFNPNTGGWRSG